MRADVMAPDVGQRMREARELSGLTQGQVGDAAGRKWQVISEWERTVRAPQWHVLERVCARLDWPMAMFLDGGPRPAEALMAQRTRPAGASLDIESRLLAIAQELIGIAQAVGDARRLPAQAPASAPEVPTAGPTGATAAAAAHATSAPAKPAKKRKRRVNE